MRSQCQRYTAAPGRTLPVPASTMVSSMVSGTPSAVADPVPTLRRMSLRTMPAWVRALGPLVPSPGKGPAVSCGMRPTAAAVFTATGDGLVVAGWPVVVADVAVEPEEASVDVPLPPPPWRTAARRAAAPP